MKFNPLTLNASNEKETIINNTINEINSDDIKWDLVYDNTIWCKCKRSAENGLSPAASL